MLKKIFAHNSLTEAQGWCAKMNEQLQKVIFKLENI